MPAESQTSTAGGEVVLLLPRNVLSWSLSYSMHMHERRYAVDPRRVVDSGEDFDIVSFALQAA